MARSPFPRALLDFSVRPPVAERCSAQSLATAAKNNARMCAYFVGVGVMGRFRIHVMPWSWGAISTRAALSRHEDTHQAPPASRRASVAQGRSWKLSTSAGVRGVEGVGSHSRRRSAHAQIVSHPVASPCMCCLHAITRDAGLAHIHIPLENLVPPRGKCGLGMADMLRPLELPTHVSVDTCATFRRLAYVRARFGCAAVFGDGVHLRTPTRR